MGLGFSSRGPSHASIPLGGGSAHHELWRAGGSVRGQADHGLDTRRPLICLRPVRDCLSRGSGGSEVELAGNGATQWQPTRLLPQVSATPARDGCLHVLVMPLEGSLALGASPAPEVLARLQHPSESQLPQGLPADTQAIAHLCGGDPGPLAAFVCCAAHHGPSPRGKRSLPGSRRPAKWWRFQGSQPRHRRG